MNTMSKKGENYINTSWIPPGWKKEEWQIVWRKLWLLTKDELRDLAKSLGTFFTNAEIQKKDATKEDFISIIDDGVDKKDLLEKLNQLLEKKGYNFDEKNFGKLIKILDDLIKK